MALPISPLQQGVHPDRVETNRTKEKLDADIRSIEKSIREQKRESVSVSSRAIISRQLTFSRLLVPSQCRHQSRGCDGADGASGRSVPGSKEGDPGDEGAQLGAYSPPLHLPIKPRTERFLVKRTLDRKSTRLNSSHKDTSRMPSSA